MKPIIQLIALLALTGCQTSDKVTQAEIHAFVVEARAEYGTNRNDWPPQVQLEFDRLLNAYRQQQ